MHKKSFNNEAMFAVINEGVSAARIELMKLKNLLNRAKTLVEKSSHKELLYREAGDLIISIPKRVEYLETFLDKTMYALSMAGKETLKSKIPLEERLTIEESFEQTSDLRNPTTKRKK